MERDKVVYIHRRKDTYEEALQARLEAEEKYWGIPIDIPVP